MKDADGDERWPGPSAVDKVTVQVYVAPASNKFKVAEVAAVAVVTDRVAPVADVQITVDDVTGQPGFGLRTQDTSRDCG